jgi:hypothetical protein
MKEQKRICEIGAIYLWEATEEIWKCVEYGVDDFGHFTYTFDKFSTHWKQWKPDKGHFYQEEFESKLYSEILRKFSAGEAAKFMLSIT